MISVKNISKKYGNHYALNDISFEAEAGEVLGFLGPNGAGKSTTMNIITGYIGCSEGDAFIDGVSVTKEPLKAKSKIGYLPEQPPLYPDMTVSEYLEFVFALKRVKGSRAQILSEIMRKVRITDMFHRLIKNLSKGYKQRVGLAAAMVGDPSVLILDEPTAGLDPRQIVEIRSLIKNLGRDKTVIFSTHILSEVQSACDRIIIINEGKIVAADTAAGLEERAAQTINIAALGDFEKAESILKDLPEASAAEVTERGEVNRFSITATAGVDLDIQLPSAIFNAFSEAGVTLVSMSPSRQSLEEIFMDLTTKGTVTETITKAATEEIKDDGNL